YCVVVIPPLVYDPANIARGNDIQSMVRKLDYNHAISLAQTIEANPRKNANELAALGTAELAAGRYDDARRHLRAAIDLQPFRTVYSSVAWDLSQVEYMSNNFDSSLDWAKLAEERGINVKQWHLDYLASLANTNVYHFSGANSERVP